MEKQNIGDKVANSIGNLIFSFVGVALAFVFGGLVIGAVVNTCMFYHKLDGKAFHLTMAPLCIMGAILLVLIYIAYQVKQIREKK